MLGWKFSFAASRARRPARTAGACTRGRVSTARFGGSGQVRARRRRWDRVLRPEPVRALPGEAPFWSCVSAWSDPADSRTRLPTLAFGLAVSRA